MKFSTLLLGLLLILLLVDVLLGRPARKEKAKNNIRKKHHKKERGRKNGHSNGLRRRKVSKNAFRNEATVKSFQNEDLEDYDEEPIINIRFRRQIRDQQIFQTNHFFL